MLLQAQFMNEPVSNRVYFSTICFTDYFSINKVKFQPISQVELNSK